MGSAEGTVCTRKLQASNVGPWRREDRHSMLVFIHAKPGNLHIPEAVQKQCDIFVRMGGVVPTWAHGGAAHCGKSPPVLDSEAWRSQLNLSLEAVGKSEKPSARHLACEPQPWQAMEVAAERNMPTLAGPDTAALLSDSSQECLGQSKARGSPGASVVEHCFGFSMADYFPFLSKPWSTLGL
ncbi:unnamed protein product [Lepidochelys kempii]